MSEEMKTTVDEWRNQGVVISDEEVEDVLQFCHRKMEICKIKDKVAYLPLLFADEIKNYIFRRSINATTMLRQLERELKEDRKCAKCV